GGDGTMTTTKTSTTMTAAAVPTPNTNSTAEAATSSGSPSAIARLAPFFAHGVLRIEPAGSADIDVVEVEKPGLDTGGFGDGGGVAVVGGDQAQVGQGAEDGPAGGAGGGGAVAGQAGHHLAVRGRCLADLPLDQAEDQQGQADHGDQRGDAPV